MAARLDRARLWPVPSCGHYLASWLPGRPDGSSAAPIGVSSDGVAAARAAPEQRRRRSPGLCNNAAIVLGHSGTEPTRTRHSRISGLIGGGLRNRKTHDRVCLTDMIFDLPTYRVGQVHLDPAGGRLLGRPTQPRLVSTGHRELQRARPTQLDPDDKSAPDCLIASDFDRLHRSTGQLRPRLPPMTTRTSPPPLVASFLPSTTGLDLAHVQQTGAHRAGMQVSTVVSPGDLWDLLRDGREAAGSLTTSPISARHRLSPQASAMDRCGWRSNSTWELLERFRGAGNAARTTDRGLPQAMNGIAY